MDSEELGNISRYSNKYKVDIILDITGLMQSKKLLSFLKWQGKYIIVGFMNKNFYHIPSNHILIKGLSIFGIRAGEFLRKSKKKKNIIRNIINIIKQDNINTFNYKIVDFKKLVNYLKKLENRTSLGKNIVVTKYYKKKNYE